MFVPVSAERSPGKSPEQDNMDFLMQESCSNKSLLYRDMLRMFLAGSAFEVMQHSSMYPSLEEGRLSRQEQQCCQGFDFVAWQLYFDRSESSPADQGFATNQGCLAAVQFLSSTAGYSIFNPTSIFSWNIANCLELSLHLLGFGHSGVFPTHHGLGPTPKECQHCS